MAWALPRGLTNAYIWWGNGTVAATSLSDPRYGRNDRLVNERQMKDLLKADTVDIARFNLCFDRMKGCLAVLNDDRNDGHYRWLRYHLPRYRWIGQRYIEIISNEYVKDFQHQFPGYSIKPTLTQSCNEKIQSSLFYNGTTWTRMEITEDFTINISCPFAPNLYPHHN